MARCSFDSARSTVAEKYIARIKNKNKHQYAVDYWRYMNRLCIGSEPERPRGLSVMGGQAVRLSLHDLAGVTWQED